MARKQIRQTKGNVLSTFLGLLLLIIIGGLCALGGFFLGSKHRPDQTSTAVTTNSAVQRNNSTKFPVSVGDSDLLSRSIPFSDEDLRSQCIRLKFAPLQRGDLAFDVVVPQNWTWQTVQVNESDLATSNTREVQIGEIESPGSSLAIMQVWFMQVPEGVSLSQFADSYTKARGFKMVEKAAEVGNRMDMLIGYDTPKQKDIQSRITAIKVGKNVIWLASCAPRSEYPIWNRTFNLAANSFSPAAAPIAFQPDVPTKLAEGAILAKEGQTIDGTRPGAPMLGQPAVPKPAQPEQNGLTSDKSATTSTTTTNAKQPVKEKSTTTTTTIHSNKQPPLQGGGTRSTQPVLH